VEARRRRIVLAAVLCGLLFLLVYGIALFFIQRNLDSEPIVNLAQRRIQDEFFLLAGLYVGNFLTIALAVMLPVDTLSGEISSGIMQTLASKPIERAAIVLGKWLTYWLMTAAYLAFMGGGIVLLMRLLMGLEQSHILAAFALMLLGATVLLTVSTAGGTRLSTITNGLVAFAFYGVAFIGGWIEQIGTLVRNQAARYIGTAISLVSPVDAMWRRAAYELQPPLMRDLQVTPFSAASVPSAAMIAWTLGFVIATLGLALYWFRRRAL
jgi:ABC-2 type transport system permease protein